nr:hypothetical protein PJ912_00530 [Pectobacterium colocasium]
MINRQLSTFVLSLCLMLPWLAQAGPAADFAAASRTQQAELLQQWAAAPEPARLPLLQALRDESVVLDRNQQPFRDMQGTLTPLEGNVEPVGATKNSL